ncbi:MAG: Maf family protein [Bacteriovoracaceae bacterium]|jgi:septum formation protein|nr:Maf family protein [Bacteriovoracaceae bacterium]
MKRLILASSSKYRKELLDKLGIEYDAISPNIDEDFYKKTIHDPKELSTILAKQKAKAIFKQYPTATIIGSDQVCHFNGKILSKTKSVKKSIEVLKGLSGNTHELITSFCLIQGDKEILHTNITQLKMKVLTQSQIEKYVKEDNPIDCAGSYKLEQRGICLFDSIECCDHTAIIGLPIIALSKDLSQLGFDLFQSL